MTKNGNVIYDEKGRAYTSKFTSAKNSKSGMNEYTFIPVGYKLSVNDYLHIINIPFVVEKGKKAC